MPPKIVRTMDRSTCRFVSVLIVLFHAALASSSTPWPYLQIYPPVNESDGRTPLYFALMLSFGGDFTSIGALPGVQIALDYVNSEPSILPGYSLHYTLTDSQCNRSIALNSFFDQIRTPPTKVGWMGSGCSIATEPTAELTPFYNITQVACISSSLELRNRQRFKYYFQLLASEVLIAQGFTGIIENYGWKKVSIIIQDENLFTVTMNSFKQQLVNYGIEYIEKRFRSEDGINGIGTDLLFESDLRIFVVAMYAVHARDFLCEMCGVPEVNDSHSIFLRLLVGKGHDSINIGAAYKQGIHYPKYMLLTYGWYSNGWWKGEATSSQYNCTDEQRASVLLNTLAPLTQEYPLDFEAEADTGITPSQFNSSYWEAVDSDINQEINLASYITQHTEPFQYSYQCHEGMLTFAYAINKTIAGLSMDSDLNRAAAELSGLPEGENFTLANFTYANSAVLSEVLKHLQDTSFAGITSNNVTFNDEGIRLVYSLTIYQYLKSNADESREPERKTIGMVTDTGGGGFTFNYIDPFSASSPGVWPDGIPNDGIPDEDIVTVHIGITVVYVTLATAGLMFAVVCLVFNLVFRQKRLIRLSSPNLNYIIGLGAIVLYLNVITFVIPTTNEDVAAVLCNINPWLTSLGYSLCYGTILIKMVRVWLIFNKPFELKRSPLIKDFALALFVLCLVVADLAILGAYTLTEGLRKDLGVKRITSRENPEDIIGPTAEIHKYSLYICESKGQVVLYAVLFGYKGLLQVIALILAFRTRKVKLKGLDDSKYIAAAIYISSIVLAVIIVSTYTLRAYENIYPAVVGIGFLLGTTMILALVFVPRMVGLYNDPEGRDVAFTTSAAHPSTIDQKSSGAVKEVRGLRRRVTELENSLKLYETSGNISPGYPLSSDTGKNFIHDCKESPTHFRIRTASRSHAVQQKEVSFSDGARQSDEQSSYTKDSQEETTVPDDIKDTTLV